MERFRIYNTGKQVHEGIPEAAEEHRISILFKDQDTGFVGTTSKTYGKILGYMTDEFSYAAAAQYNNIYDISFGSGLFAKVLKDESQRTMLTYGYATKKTFAQGPTPSLSVKFRIYAGDNLGGYITNESKVDNNPVTVANVLFGSTMSRVGKSAFFNFTALSKTTAAEVVKTDWNLMVGGAKYIAAKLTGGSTSGADVNFDNAVEGNANILSSFGSAIANASPDSLFPRNPPMCYIEIGNIFKKDFMVVKNVEFTFSKEYYKKGVPLYGDFTVTLESLFNAANQQDAGMESIFGSGLNGDTTNGSRVTFE